MTKRKTAAQVKKSFDAGMKRAAKRWGKVTDKILAPYLAIVDEAMKKASK